MKTWKPRFMKGFRVLKRSLLHIPRGERHEIRSTGRALLRTLNLYAPPAFDAKRELLPRGRK